MGLFKENSDQDKLWSMLNERGQAMYSKYDDERKEEILAIFKKSKNKAINEISLDIDKEEKIKEEQENLKKYEEDLKSKEIGSSLKIRGLDNLSSLTEDLVKRADFPNDMMNISNFITQLSNIGNPTNMHMLNMSQTNVNQNFVFIKLLDEIKEGNSKIIEQNKEIIELLTIISKK
ncbi:hypothetical protein JZH61_10410 [Staphylococcus saprophyticus]|uniref:hypothetical protein n=1 Tax=Staphylococcus saprophyticus TaxID=29385 RepID=UPI0019D0E290|nr:hypothetical protein [Staphylococcus saprophyticus]MBN6204238.1 hypothetical protein [Staphylococcus saprophyticus]